MNIKSMSAVLCKMAMCAAVSLSGVLAYADSLVLRNDNTVAVTLSDLIVYGLPDLFSNPPVPLKSHVFLKPGDATDNQTIAAGGSVSFDLDNIGFPYSRHVVVSVQTEVLNGSAEPELTVRFAKPMKPLPFSFFLDRADDTALVVTLFDLPDRADVDPAVVYDFTNGISSDLPGWLLNRNLDFLTGVSTGAFSGQARVVSSGLNLFFVPEPGSTGLIAFGLLCCIVSRRIVGK